MNLYEVTNGYIGESYIRVYVWCESREEARRMAIESFKKKANEEPRYDEDYWSHISEPKLLFSATDSKFVTEPSDCGFSLVRAALGGE